MARPSKYEKEILPHLDEIKKAVSAGATVEEIAEGLKIAPSTLYKYKAEKKELKEAFACGREEIIIEIKAALLKKALGYDYTEKKVYTKTDERNGETVYEEVTTRHSPPSETAAAMLLRNYDKSWLDKDFTSTDTKKQELDLKKLVAQASNFDLEI